MTSANVPPLIVTARRLSRSIGNPLRFCVCTWCAVVVGAIKIFFNLFPLPQPLPAFLSRWWQLPELHPFLDRTFAQTQVLGERAQVLVRWRVR
jgi:hypothetical protein